MKTHIISASAQVELDPITARPRGHAYADFLEEWAAEMVLQGAPWKKIYRNGWIMMDWLENLEGNPGVFFPIGEVSSRICTFPLKLIHSSIEIIY